MTNYCLKDHALQLNDKSLNTSCGYKNLSKNITTRNHDNDCKTNQTVTNTSKTVFKTNIKNNSATTHMV